MPEEADDGFTLVELIVAIAILGVAIVVIVGAMGTAFITTDIHRKSAVGAATIRSYAEAIKAAPYVRCGGSADYQNPSGFTSPTGYTSTITGVTYWEAATTSFMETCTSITDPGVQKISVRVVSTDVQVRGTETLIVVKRNPCTGTSVTPCA